jgi:hypothetical protein
MKSIQKEFKFVIFDLYLEAQLLQKLQKYQGFPKLITCGQTEEYSWTVMEQLGESLGSLFQKCNYKFSVKSTLMILY